MFQRFRSRTAVQAELDAALDKVVHESFLENPPAVLYHYTSWEAAEGILRGRAFWATAHDCTNDPAELTTADDVVLRVATRLRAELGGECAELIKLLLDGYSRINVRSVASNYLACFSAARDKASQWLAYAEGGAGVCLAVPVLSEAPPTDGVGRALIRVRYSEAEVEAAVEHAFRQVCRLLRRAVKQGAPRNNDTARPAVSALYRIAGLAALAAKQSDWREEEEWRVVAIVTPSLDKPLRRVRPGGEEVRYIELPLRSGGRPIVVSELILGPGQEPDVARARAEHLLGTYGYILTGDGATIVTASASSTAA